MWKWLLSDLVILVLAFASCGHLASGKTDVDKDVAAEGLPKDPFLSLKGSRDTAVSTADGKASHEELAKDVKATAEEGEGEEEKGGEEEEDEGGEEEEGEEEEGEEGEEEGDTGISIMLIGSIAFMMSLYYVTNTKDPDFAVYSWEVINKTISIFSAVLLFQATQGVVLFYAVGKTVEEERRLLSNGPFFRRLGEEEGEEEEAEFGTLGLIVAFSMMLFWYMVLQLTLAYLTGAIDIGSTPDGSPSVEVSHYNYKMGVLSQEQKDEFKRMHVNLKCLGVLIGHITGFAAINALGLVQQMYSSKEGIFETESWRQVMAFVVCFGSFWVLTGVHKVTDLIRNKVALGDDGEIDEAEEMWQEETVEVEDDVIGLAISFLFIQAVRYQVGASLPDVEGEDEDKHGITQVVLLFAIGMGMMFLLLLKAQYLPVRDARKNAQLGNIVSMAFAWCLYFSVYWFISAELKSIAEGMLSEVIIALVVTLFGLGLIAIADKMADAEWTAPEIDKIIRGEVVTAIGILIGFSWEKNFDKAVTTIACAAISENHPEVPIFVKLIMSVLCAGITVPAWWIYILPPLLNSKENLDQRMAVEKINYMIKFRNKYVDWPTEVEAPENGDYLNAPLLSGDASPVHGLGSPTHADHQPPMGRRESNNSHHHGHHHGPATEPDTRKVLRTDWHAKKLGLAIVDIDATRELPNQEFQSLLIDGKYCMKFNPDEGEWELREEKTLEQKIQQMEESIEEMKKEHKELEEQYTKELNHLKDPNGRLREVEEQNQVLQEHIHGYGKTIEELKRMAEALHDEHLQ